MLNEILGVMIKELLLFAYFSKDSAIAPFILIFFAPGHTDRYGKEWAAQIDRVFRVEP
jgi:hypothetical protein